MLPEERLKIAFERAGTGTLAVAESCTGGTIAARITSVPGSSAYFDRGYVVYSNRAKVEMLGVQKELIEAHGAVSPQVAEAMLHGVLARSGANLGAAVTGIAGPDGGSVEKPVGTVWIAWGLRDRRFSELLILPGGRNEVRARASEEVLERLCRLLEEGREPAGHL